VPFVCGVTGARGRGAGLDRSSPLRPLGLWRLVPTVLGEVSLVAFPFRDVDCGYPDEQMHLIERARHLVYEGLMVILGTTTSTSTFVHALLGLAKNRF